MFVKTSYWIALVVVLTVVAACGADDDRGPAVQGIEGRFVMTGPGHIRDCTELSSGDERDDCEESNKPWTTPMAAADIEVRDEANRLVTTVVTDNNGAFRVELPEGEYLLCSAGCEGPIAVVAGEFTDYDISVAVP